MLLFSTAALAATLTVGPGQDHETVSAAILASSPGDEILIAPGEYLDDTVAFPHGDLVIRAAGDERPVLRVTQDIPNRKGIFAIPVGAGPVTVEGVHFEGARISDGDGANGAGIRMQGSALTVRDCVFRDNQMGILAGGTEGFTLDVQGSEFDNNGRDGSGYEHNLYVGTDQCAEFVFIGNYSHHAATGHQLKSRCQVNLIAYNRLMDEDDGHSSYIIDLPEGGRSFLIGNLLQQGPMAENTSAIVSYGAEGENDEMSLYVAHNTLVNDRESEATAFVRVNRGAEVVLRNNLFVGAGTPLLVNDEGAAVDEAGTLAMADGAALVDRAGFDYALVEGSAPQDAGVVFGELGGQALVVDQQYAHPAGVVPRWDEGAPDIGAYGIGEPPDSATPGDSGDSSAADDTAGIGASDKADEGGGCGCAGVGGLGGWGALWAGAAALARRRRRA